MAAQPAAAGDDGFEYRVLASTGEGARIRLGDGRTELAVARERARALEDRLGL